MSAAAAAPQRNLATSLINALIIGGVSWGVWELYQCKKKNPDGSIIGCIFGDISDWIQNESNKLQCSLLGNSALGSKQIEFPTSPIGWFASAFSTVSSWARGKGFAQAANENGLAIDCAKFNHTK